MTAPAVDGVTRIDPVASATAQRVASPFLTSVPNVAALQRSSGRSFQVMLVGAESSRPRSPARRTLQAMYPVRSLVADSASRDLNARRSCQSAPSRAKRKRARSRPKWCFAWRAAALLQRGIRGRVGLVLCLDITATPAFARGAGVAGAAYGPLRTSAAAVNASPATTRSAPTTGATVHRPSATPPQFESLQSPMSRTARVSPPATIDGPTSQLRLRGRCNLRCGGRSLRATAVHLVVAVSR